MKYDAVICDLDGTLVDTERYHYLAYKTICEDIGYPLSEEEFCTRWMEKGWGTADLHKELGIPFDRESFQREKRSRFLSLAPKKLNLMPGVQEFLDYALLHKIKLAVATGSQRYEAEWTLEAAGIRDYFSIIVSVTDVKKGKPEPDIFLQTVEGLNVPKDRCLIIENAVIGLIPAIKAGIKCIIVPSWLTKNGDFTGAYNVVPIITDVINELE